MSAQQLGRLQASLTQVFNRSAVLRPAISLSFSLPHAIAHLTIDGHVLSVTIEEIDTSNSPFDYFERDRTFFATSAVSSDVAEFKAVTELQYDLRRWTVERFIEDLNSRQGFAATLVDPRLAKLLAAAIFDSAAGHDLTIPLLLSVDLNPLTTLLKPVAFAIYDHEANIDTALAQLNLLTSEQYFADYWGGLLGILRLSGESDLDYTQRIVDEIMRKRDNNRSLEIIIAARFGLNATVEDLLPLVLNINNSICTSKIPGEIYNVGNFLVNAELTDDDIIGLVNRHRAGGTRAFFHRIANAGFSDSELGMSSDFFDDSLFDSKLKPEQEIGVFSGINGEIAEIDVGLPIWTVGSTPMPGSRIA
jgi:hypothetical protein